MPRIERILCPVDFSETSRHAIEHAGAIAGWYGARLNVLHVYSPIFMPVPGLPAPTNRVPDVERQRVHDEAAAFVRAPESLALTSMSASASVSRWLSSSNERRRWRPI